MDQQTQQSKTQKLTEILSVLFILLLLLFTFRALLAPFIALIPSGIALIAAEPLIAASAHVGVPGMLTFIALSTSAGTGASNSFCAAGE